MERLYVAQGKAGILKVGRTSNYKTRLTRLKQEFRRFGDELDRVECCDEVHCAFGVENALIREASARCVAYSGREWFESGDFGLILSIAQRETARALAEPIRPPITPEQIAEWQRKGEARRLAKKAGREDRKARAIENKKVIAARRELRAKRQMEIALRLISRAGVLIDVEGAPAIPEVA